MTYDEIQEIKKVIQEQIHHYEIAREYNQRLENSPFTKQELELFDIYYRSIKQRTLTNDQALEFIVLLTKYGRWIDRTLASAVHDNLAGRNPEMYDSSRAMIANHIISVANYIKQL